MAAVDAAIGMVRIQAQTILPATPQRTADSRFAAPTPMIAPVIVWVVLTGIPRADARKIAVAPPVSAQKPPNGRSLVIRVPIVLTIRQPPSAVPNAIAPYAPISIQSGILSAVGR